MRPHLCGCAVEVRARLLDALALDRSGHVNLPHHGVGTGRLLHEHAVDLVPVAVEAVVLAGDQRAPPERLGVEPAHRDGDLRLGVGVERVEQS